MAKSRGSARDSGITANQGIIQRKPLQSTDTTDGVTWTDNAQVYRSTAAGTDEVLQQYFGRVLTDSELIGLVGAPDGAVMSVYAYDVTKNGVKRVSIAIQTQHPHYESNTRSITLGDDGKPYIYNDSFTTKPSAPAGLATRVLARQVIQARKLGIERIETTASRTTEHVGYKVWPKLGYDGPIVSQSMSPAAVKRVKRFGRTILDVYSTPAGRAIWETLGQSIHLTFDTFSASRSSVVLRSYLKQKGYQVRDF